MKNTTPKRVQIEDRREFNLYGPCLHYEKACSECGKVCIILSDLDIVISDFVCTICTSKKYEIPF